MEKVHIALAADENYAQHVGVVLLSILTNSNNPQKMSITLLSLGISDSTKDTLRKFADEQLCELNCFEIDDEQIGNIDGRGYISKATFCRLFLTNLLPHSIEKIIYLDTDIIVRHDIRELWKTDVTDYHVAAVVDTGLRPGWLEQMGFPEGESYFNAGMLVINLSKWREDNIGQHCLDYVRERSDSLKYPDQDALNVCLCGKWLHLHPKWNVTKGVFRASWKPRQRKRLSQDDFLAIADPGLIHFTGAYKPWHYACGLPFAGEYMEHVKNSPWSDYQYPDINLKGLLKRKEYHLRRYISELLYS